MKKCFIILGFLFIAGCVNGQSSKTKPISSQKQPSASSVVDTVPPYRRDNHLPDFTIQLPDSSFFTKENLPKGFEYTAIIYFSPDCSHCQHTAKDVVKAMDSLKNVFFVFAAYKPLEDIRGFMNYYGLDQFKNIVGGRDPKYFIPAFYRVQYTPFVAVYNKAGLLVQVYDPPNRPSMEVPELVEFVNRH